MPATKKQSEGAICLLVDEISFYVWECVIENVVHDNFY